MEWNCPILKKCSFQKCFLWLTLQIVAFRRAQYILRPTNTNRRNWFTRKKCIHEKNWVFKSAIKQMCLVRSIDIHPTLREAWYEEVSVTSLLCSRNFGTPSTSTTLPKQGMSGAINNKNQSNSLFINPSLIALRGNVCKVSFCLEWSANFTNLLNVVRAQNLCVFAATDAVVFDSKNGISFLLCSPLMDQGLVTLFTHLTQIDLPE